MYLSSGRGFTAWSDPDELRGCILRTIARVSGSAIRKPPPVRCGRFRALESCATNSLGLGRSGWPPQVTSVGSCLRETTSRWRYSFSRILPGIAFGLQAATSPGVRVPGHLKPAMPVRLRCLPLPDQGESGGSSHRPRLPLAPEPATPPGVCGDPLPRGGRPARL